MSERDWKLLLEDIIDGIKAIEEFTDGLTYNDFENNRLVSDAVVRNIEVI